MFGGKCERCGYDKCIGSLHFHHTDPSNKSFDISGNHGRKISSLIEECKKCILICANCHGEEHYNNQMYKQEYREAQELSGGSDSLDNVEDDAIIEM